MIYLKIDFPENYFTQDLLYFVLHSNYFMSNSNKYWFIKLFNYLDVDENKASIIIN